MRLVIDAARIEATEVRTRLDQRRDTTRHAVTLGVSLAQLGRQQVRQLDLADLAFDLVVSHRRFEVVFETVLAEQLDEELLGQIGVGSARAFFNKQAGASRRTNEGMMRDYAVQVGPETIDV